MKELITLLTSTKGTAGNRSAVLLVLAWLVWHQLETGKTLDFLRENRCRCSHPNPAYSQHDTTNHVTTIYGQNH